MRIREREASGSTYRRLRPGPGHDASAVESHQRRRIHRAVAELIAEGGYGSVTMRKLARLAGVSTATLYAQFAGKDDCVLSAHDGLMDRIVSEISSCRACSGRSGSQLSEAIQVALAGFAADPAATRLALVDVYEAGAIALPRARASEEGLAKSICAAVRQGRQPPVSAVSARWIAAGILRVARTAAIEGRPAPSGDAVRELSRWSAAVGASEPRALVSVPTANSLRKPSIAAPPLPELIPARTERDLVLAAVARLGVDQGYWRLSPTTIRRAAGVTRACFDRCFDDLDECYLASVERHGERFLETLLRGPSGPDRETTMRRRVASLHAAVLSNTSTARFVFLGILAPGTAGLLRRERMVGDFAAKVSCASRSKVDAGETSITLDLAALWSTLAIELALEPVRDKRMFAQI